LKSSTILLIAFSFAGVAALSILVFRKPATKAFSRNVQYELVRNWPQLPDNFLLGNPTGIGIDTNQNLVVFHRASREWPFIMPMPTSIIKENTILVLNKETGRIINSWGSGRFVMPHGLTVDRRNNIWLTDVGLHQVFKFSYDGKLLLKLGEAGIAGNDKAHFNKPTDVAVAADGSFYISDGYGNSRIVKFSASGKYLLEWGKSGTKPGEFDIPHAIDLDKSGNVYVADRENARIQVFTADGIFISQWRDADWGSVCSIGFDAVNNRFIAVDDLTTFKVKHNGSDIITLDSMGNQLARFGRSGLYSGPKSWYHDVTVDREGNIYVGDILGNKLQKFKPRPLKKTGSH